MATVLLHAGTRVLENCSPWSPSYSELQENALQLATCTILKDHHSACGNVGLYGECCPEVIAALIAVMAIPGAYIPLSVHQPLKQRVEFLRKNEIDIILVQESVLEVGHYTLCLISIDETL